jgi:predicted lipid-binding transport protein (Tim44 family)
MLRFRAASSALAAAMLVLTLVASASDARPGGGGSFGSRGTRTFTAPSITRTAPSPVAPMQRSITQPTQPSPGVTRPAWSGTGGLLSRPGLFGGLLAGFVGAGLLGLLLGHGVFGGLAGIGSLFGLLLQIGLIVIVGRLIWNWWQRRNGYAMAGGPAVGDTGHSGNPYARSGFGGFGGGAPVSQPVTLSKSDFDTFERLLNDVTLAYAASDLGRLRRIATPEMVSYFADDLAGHASRGLVSETSDVKLLQGDLSEAWREDNVEYATVAMRYQLTDALVERETGRVVEGSRSPQEVTELWTFMRQRAGQWMLSAIQQTH